MLLFYESVMKENIKPNTMPNIHSKCNKAMLLLTFLVLIMLGIVATLIMINQKC